MPDPAAPAQPGSAHAAPDDSSVPHAQPAATVVASLRSDADGGLTAAEAAARLDAAGPNELRRAAAVPGWRRMVAQLADPLVLLLLVAAAVSVLAWAAEGARGVPYEPLVILAIVVGNAGLGMVQEQRAEQAVAALQRLARPMATVVRDGTQRAVAAAELVPGDVVLLAEGDAVPADARLLEAATLLVAEAALTGESEAVLKAVGEVPAEAALGDRRCMVLAGTVVTRGRARAVVTATGMGTELGRIADLLESTPAVDTPLHREIGKVGRLLGVVVVLISVVVVGTVLLTSDIESAADVVGVLLLGVSLAVAAVPEGLPAVLSVVLALGVQRMAARHAIVKRLASVETLGSATVVCTDKTGTLTRNEMTVRVAHTPSCAVALSGTGYEATGQALDDGEPVLDPVLLEELRLLLGGGALCSDARLQREGGGWAVAGDPTEGALLVAQQKVGLAGERVHRRYPRTGELPFTSERKLMSTVHADRERDDRLVLVTKGAPDVLLTRCGTERVAGVVRPLGTERREQVLADVDGLAAEALRTLAVAYRPLAAGELVDGQPAESVERDLTYLGVVGILDPPRDEAAHAIGAAHRAGIRVVMVTGDHPRTAASIAAALGLAGPGRVVTGPEIAATPPAALPALVAETSVFARVAPEHKLLIVGALQAQGEIVAMTGDGVNDAPALKSADIGVAMGRTGTDVAKEAADMILTNDDIGTIVNAVLEGRRVLSNIRKFLRYLLSSNLGEVLTVFLGIVLAGFLGLHSGGGLATPLLAVQILWINLLTDSTPALAMGVDPPADDLMRRPPRAPGQPIIDRSMRADIAIVGTVMAAATLLTLDLGLPGGLVDGDGTLDQARTAAFTTLVLAQLFNAFNARSDHVSARHGLLANRWLWGAVAVSALLQVAVVHVPLLNKAFGTQPLSAGQWLVCLLVASSVLWAAEARKWAVRRRHTRVMARWPA